MIYVAILIVCFDKLHAHVECLQFHRTMHAACTLHWPPFIWRVSLGWAGGDGCQCDNGATARNCITPLILIQLLLLVCCVSATKAAAEDATHAPRLLSFSFHLPRAGVVFHSPQRDGRMCSTIKSRTTIRITCMK